MTARELIAKIEALVNQGALSSEAQVKVFFDGRWYKDLRVEEDPAWTKYNTLCIDVFE